MWLHSAINIDEQYDITVVFKRIHFIFNCLFQISMNVSVVHVNMEELALTVSIDTRALASMDMWELFVKKVNRAYLHFSVLPYLNSNTSIYRYRWIDGTTC